MRHRRLWWFLLALVIAAPSTASATDVSWQINISNAAPQVVAALPGMDPQRLNAVLVQREAGPQNAQGLPVYSDGYALLPMLQYPRGEIVFTMAFSGGGKRSAALAAMTGRR